MASTKEIKWRIKTVTNTEKITRAMELISTVKMKKAQDSVLSSRPFAIGALKILSTMEDSISDSLFFAKPKKENKKELLIVISSNKWLCGWYNVNIFKKVAEYLKNNKDKSFEFISIWKKSQDFILRTGSNLIGDFSEVLTDNIELSESRKVSKDLINKFSSLNYDKVVVFYSYYVSAITQKSVAKQFLTINKQDIISYLEEIVWINNTEQTKSIDYAIEPDKNTITNEIIPMILDMMFYEILLEAKASEHASRMVAMKNAKDSAGKKVFELTLKYNKARQANITKEISELVSGVESMKE